MEQHVGTQLEGIGELVRRYGPRFCEVSLNLRVIGRVEFQKRRIVRRDWVQNGEGHVGMTVVVRRLRVHGEFESTAALRGSVGKSFAARRARHTRQKRSRKDSRIAQR